MSDLISRQAAIDALDKRFDSIPMEQTTEILLLRKDLRELPSAQPEKRTEERTETHACDLISRQAAIDAHYEYCNKHPDASFPVWSLKILENLPSAQPETSPKISEILDYLDTILHPLVSPEHYDVYSTLHDMISLLGLERPQRTGRWIPTDNESFKQCSECGRHVYAYKYPTKAYPYCHCGAKMEDEK